MSPPSRCSAVQKAYPVLRAVLRSEIPSAGIPQPAKLGRRTAASRRPIPKATSHRLPTALLTVDHGISLACCRRHPEYRLPPPNVQNRYAAIPGLSFSPLPRPSISSMPTRTPKHYQRNLGVIFSAWPRMRIDNPHGHRIAWMQDGTENRVPQNRRWVSWSTVKIAAVCFRLPKLGRDVVFHKH